MPVGHRRGRPNQGSIHSLHEQHGDPKRTPHGDKDTAQVLQYALNKERGQENQRAIAGRLRAINTIDHQIAHINPNQFPQQRRTQPHNIRNPTNQQRRPQQQRNQGQHNPCDDAEPHSHSNTSRSAPPRRLSATIANEWAILQKSAGPLDPLGT